MASRAGCGSPSHRANSRQHYGVGLTQILTRNLIATVNVETITDDGFPNNPYRSVRIEFRFEALFLDANIFQLYFSFWY